MQEVATAAGCDVSVVRAAIENGMLKASTVGGQQFVTRTNCTLWSKHGAPTGDSAKSWISLDGAEERYGFSQQELQAFVDSGRLKHQRVKDAVLVSRLQCTQLRDQVGFSAEHAAARLGIAQADLPTLLQGLEWRPADGLIPLAVIRAAAKRLGERPARQPAQAVGVQEDWVIAARATEVAGISLGTLWRWAANRSVARRFDAGGWRYSLSDLQAQARQYWNGRQTKPGRPKWLEAEAAS